MYVPKKETSMGKGVNKQIIHAVHTHINRIICRHKERNELEKNVNIQHRNTKKGDKQRTQMKEKRRTV
jgi:hypothetical protein